VTRSNIAIQSAGVEETTMTAYRLLTAIVMAALVLPAQAGNGDLEVVSSPELLVVGGNRPGDPAQRLVVRALPSGPNFRRASVSYEQSGIKRFTATVSIGSRTIDVEGAAGPDPFDMHWVDLGRGAGVEASFRFGEASFDAFVSQAGPDDVTIEDFARFREAVERSAGWPVVQEVNLYLSSASVDSPLLVMAVLATFGAGATTGYQASGSPLEAYLDCLSSSCGTCGGCWHNYPWADCYACPRQPYWERVVAGACYLASTTLCLEHLLISLPATPD
jgi:hypothetical protein